jgi:hypothetical protein
MSRCEAKNHAAGFNPGFRCFQDMSSLDPRSSPEFYSIAGVIRILDYGGNPTPIEDREIGMIRSISDSALPAEPHPYLQTRDRIRLADGPLSGVCDRFLAWVSIEPARTRPAADLVAGR